MILIYKITYVLWLIAVIAEEAQLVMGSRAASSSWPMLATRVSREKSPLRAVTCSPGGSSNGPKPTTISRAYACAVALPTGSAVSDAALRRQGGADSL